MTLAIVAATGGIGRQLLDQAVRRGDAVTAVVRNPQTLPKGVRAVRVDLSTPDPGALASALDGVDAVLSGLGAKSAADAWVWINHISESWITGRLG